MHLLPNTVRRLKLNQFSSLEDQKLSTGALKACLEDLMILAVIVLQAYPQIEIRPQKRAAV
jgi:hypothetical protein